jgi:GNAT superfamily N-acetyltransferase
VEAEATHDSAGLPIRPLPDGSDIRKATPEDQARVVEALARGFYDDPLLTWIFPDGERRLQQNERAFDVFVRRVYLPVDEIYTTDRFAGAACWMPPGTAEQSAWGQLRMLPGMVAAARGALPRLMAVLTAFDKGHPHEEHWYLPVIAVLPEWQGRGFGAALLRPALERCDREHLPAYLEATSPRNRALYERHGFEVTEELRVKDAPPVWRMWRVPQAASRVGEAATA